MYAIYVVSVFAGDGFALPAFLRNLLPGGAGTEPKTWKGGGGGGGRGGFDWNRFRDTLLRRQADPAPLMLMLGERSLEHQATMGDLQSHSGLWPDSDPDLDLVRSEARGDDEEEAPVSHLLGTVAVVASVEAPPALQDFGCFGEEPDLDVPLGSANDFLPDLDVPLGGANDNFPDK